MKKKKWSSSKQVIYVNKLKNIIYDEVWEKRRNVSKNEEVLSKIIKKSYIKSEDEKRTQEK